MRAGSYIKMMVLPKMKIAIIYSPSRCSQPVHLFYTKADFLKNVFGPHWLP